MVGTPGQHKVPESLRPNRLVVPNRPIELPDLKQFEQVIIEKQAFDFATNPNATDLLHQLNPTKIAVYGVVTEICVAAAARSLLFPGRKIFLVRDAVAELDPDKAEGFFADFVAHGGHFISVEQVVASSDLIAA